MHTRVLAVVAVLALLSACAAIQRETAPQTPADASAPARMAVLPADTLVDPALIVARRGSVSTTLTTLGKDRQTSSADAEVVGNALHLPGPTGYALYRFDDLIASDMPNLLTVSLLVPQLPERLHVGLSNYDSQRWDWQQIAPVALQSHITALGPHSISPGGSIYVIVAVADDSVTIKDLALNLKYGAPPPVELRAGDGTSRFGIELTWTDPAYTYAAAPDFDHDGVAIDRAPSIDGPWSFIGLTGVGVTEYFDAGAVDGPPGLRFHYRLRTYRDGQYGVPGLPDTGYVDQRPVAVLKVTPNSEPYMPREVEFAAYDSYDPDGGALTYE